MWKSIILLDKAFPVYQSYLSGASNFFKIKKLVVIFKKREFETEKGGFEPPRRVNDLHP